MDTREPAAAVFWGLSEANGDSIAAMEPICTINTYILVDMTAGGRVTPESGHAHQFLLGDRWAFARNVRKRLRHCLNSLA